MEVLNSIFVCLCLSLHLSVFTGMSLSPQSEETSFHFDGSGFSLVQKSLRATSTSIVLLFKTLTPGGLLLYLASNNTVRHTHTHTHSFCWGSYYEADTDWPHFLSPAEGLPVHGAGGGACPSDLWSRLRCFDTDLQQEVQHWSVVQDHTAEEQTQRYHYYYDC